MGPPSRKDGRIIIKHIYTWRLKAEVIRRHLGHVTTFIKKLKLKTIRLYTVADT